MNNPTPDTGAMAAHTIFGLRKAAREVAAEDHGPTVVAGTVA